MKLSVVVIAKNEAAMIGACLESVRWADEIVVLDGGSDDATPAICREYGARVEQETDWQGFGRQKNRALDLARGDWILSLDADERVTPELRREIAAVLANPAADVFAMPRRSWYCGREIRHSGWWPDHVARLFRRGAARFSDDRVHERLLFSGAARQLSAPLEHVSFRSLDQVLDKVNRYSSAGARMMRARGRPGSLTAAVGHGLWAFVRTYFLRRGFLDGREGFILAVSNAEGVYYRYLKCMYLREEEGARS